MQTPHRKRLRIARAAALIAPIWVACLFGSAQAVPVIKSLTPTTGLPKGGTVVTINGSGFVSGATVTFGSNSAISVTFVSGSSLKATTPASTGGVEGPVDVTVTNPSAASATLTNGFTYQLPAPKITTISPTVATPAGGTVITINGSNFVSGATVTFASNAATSVTFVSATQLKATAPASTNNAEGQVNVTVTNPDAQTVTLSNGLLYQYPAPTVTKIAPTVSSTSGGTVITITGTHFLSGAAVQFGPNPATSVTFVNSTTIKATTPASTLNNSGSNEGTVSVFVTNPDNQYGTLSQGLTYHLPPSLTFVAPAAGLPSGGYQVTLNGQYFRAGATVLFGTTPATSVVFKNNTYLTVTVPAHAVGAVSVVEKNADGLQTTLANGFTFSNVYITQVTPGIGPLTGGNTVDIQGAGFTPDTTVTLGGIAATSVNIVSPNELTAVAPAHTGGAVKVTVTNASGTYTLTNGYKYSGAPIITSVSPATGVFKGGTSVTLNGFNLGTISKVTFGGATAKIVSKGPNTAKVTSPAFPGGNNPVDVAATASAGSFTLPGAFTYGFGIITKGLDDGYAGFPYSNTLKTTSGVAPVSWSITSGTLPAGLSLNTATGEISGTPAANYNTYTVTFKATDSSSPTPLSSTATLSFNILFGFTTDVIPPTFFGMIVYDQTNWPLPVSIGALGKGLGTTWPFIEQTQGVFNWSVLDQYVADAQATNVPGTNTPLTLYWTNANIPPWAASDPSTCSFYTGTNISACTSSISAAHLPDFTAFMTALVTRYQGKIQIYELWNEPDISNVYNGSLADFVTMTTTAYNAIRAANPSAIVLSPSPVQEPFLYSFFTAPGAPLGFDAVAIHGYPNVLTQDVPEAITGFKSVNIKLAMVQAPGVGVKPIWDTETSWGNAASGAISDPDLRTGFVARSFLLHWSAGIHNMYWYGWDSPSWGTLFSPPPGLGMSPAAYAYQQTYNWMVGASMPAPCTANGGSTYAAVYTCQLTRPGGYNALAVWDTNQTCSNGVCTSSNYTPDPQYIQYRDLTGTVFPISAGQTIQIGAKPILLENMSPPATP